jgi:hypothetical protein
MKTKLVHLSLKLKNTTDFIKCSSVLACVEIPKAKLNNIMSHISSKLAEILKRMTSETKFTSVSKQYKDRRTYKPISKELGN